MEYQFYWKSWYKLWPSYFITPADEYGPRELWFFFGPFQMRKYLWQKF